MAVFPTPSQSTHPRGKVHILMAKYTWAWQKERPCGKTITLDGVFCDGKWYDVCDGVKNEEKKV